MMWEKLFLLLHFLLAVGTSPCRQGETFPEAVVSPAVASSGILRVPGVASLSQCVAACCDLPGFDLAWFFRGRCYILSCQQGADCRPRVQPGADSVLAFLQRAEPQSLLQSLVRREPYDGPQQDLSDPRPLEEAGQPSDRVNQSEPEGGPETVQIGVTRISPTSEGSAGRGDEVRTRTSAEQTTRTQSRSDSAPPGHVTSRYDIISATVTSAQPLLSSVGNPVDVTSEELAADVTADPPGSSSEPDPLKSLQTQTLTAHPLLLDVTSDPCNTSSPAATTDTPAAAAEVSGSNRAPVAVVGPDRKLFLPLSSLLLDGSGSSDDQRISSFLWEVVSGPRGLKLQDADRAVAMATGVQAGRYTFRLTVCDQEGATDSASMTVKVLEARSLPPVAHASGSHVLTLPNSSLVLRGSVTDGDQNQVQYLWTRDSQSPAAGVVLFGSETQASLYLTDLVQGTYLFQLRVTDGQARSSCATATVEVRPEPGGEEQVELEMLVSVSQVSVAQRDTVVRQLAALIHVLDGDVRVRALQERTPFSSVLRFSVLGPSGPLPASRLVVLLRKQLLRETSDFLLFRVLRVDTVVCQLSCSGQGQCDPINKQCACDPFWTENLIRRYLGDGESNCEWRVLFVILSSFLLMILILTLSWAFICCSRRRNQNKGRRRTRYTILDDMDEQERLELRPRFSIKHRSTEQNSSLMMSESELDSEQDSVLSRLGRGKNRTRTQMARNGIAFG
ncbi:dyslexia-associated protein KIAA0319 homolog [Kryptolebias marmoratus]|uniref:KIAA0319 n=1 Tax=Kryptolebias marmoratus TaxID=37003 RepID=A0A3Q3B0T0_KRYMA|nr:dyslexia-associated protein KIAA0319 homolog [Kryptolebias marmoratus]